MNFHLLHFFSTKTQKISFQLFAVRNTLIGVTAVHLVSCLGMLVKTALEIARAPEFNWNRLLIYEIGRELYHITFTHQTSAPVSSFSRIAAAISARGSAVASAQVRPCDRHCVERVAYGGQLLVRFIRTRPSGAPDDCRIIRKYVLRVEEYWLCNMDEWIEIRTL